MKVITEEDAILARNALLKKGNKLGACAIDMLISDHAKEIDTLTVSKLRPMVDAPKDGEYFMAYCHPTSQKIGMFFPYRYDEDIETYVDEDDDEMCIDVVLGWIPMPIYKPEKE